MIYCGFNKKFDGYYVYLLYDLWIYEYVLLYVKKKFKEILNLTYMNALSLIILISTFFVFFTEIQA